MESIAILTALVAALFIFCRGPLVVAPTATVAFYRRMIATAKLIRISGCLFILLAAALIVTARQARAAQGDITFLVEGMGWATVAAAVWLITAPGSYQRLTNGFWDAVSTPVQRAIGVFNVAMGLGLGWLAFFVL